MDRFWPAYQQAIFAPSFDNAELAAMLQVGPNTIIGRIEAMARNGERAEMAEPSVFERRLLSVTFDRPDVAIVRECVVDDLRIVKDIRVGDQDQLLVIDDDVVTVEYTTAVARRDDGWRITVRDESEYLEGVRDCALFT